MYEHILQMFLHMYADILHIYELRFTCWYDIRIRVKDADIRIGKM
jgi:hypothetical protein